MGRNTAIKRFNPTTGTTADLFSAKEGRLGVIFEIPKSPWISRGSELLEDEDVALGKCHEDPVAVAWNALRLRGRVRESVRAFSRSRTPPGCWMSWLFEDALNRAGDVIMKHRSYLVTGTLQNNTERGLAIIAEDVRPYIVRTQSGSSVRLRRGVPSGPMGPALGGAGAPEKESWRDAGCRLR